MRIRNTESLLHEFNIPVWFKPGGSFIFCSCISAQVWVMLSRLSWTSCWPRLCRLPATSPTSSCRSCLGSPTGPRHNTGRRRRRRSGPPHLHQGKPGYRHRSVPANRLSPISRAGHATTLPRHRDHVFRPQSCWLLHYYFIPSGISQCFGSGFIESGSGSG